MTTTTDWKTLLAFNGPSSDAYTNARQARNRALKEAFPTVQFSANNWSKETQQAVVSFRLMEGALLHLEALADALKEIAPHVKRDKDGNRIFYVNYTNEHRYGAVLFYQDADDHWCMKRKTQYYMVSHPDFRSEDLNVVLQWTFHELYGEKK